MVLMKPVIFSKKNIVAALLVAVLVYVEYILRNNIDVKNSIVFELTLLRVLICSVVGYILVIIPQKNWNHYKFFKIAITAFMFVFMSGFIILVFLKPDFILGMSKEDEVVENLSAAFLLISSAVALFIGHRFFGKKEIVPTFVFLAMSILFFFMCMEEISWMQRIADIKPSEIFVKHNMQSETNLHNFNTLMFNDIYYLAGFLLLVVGTFYRKNIKELLKKFKLIDFSFLLPSRWLLLPFSLMVGLTTPIVYVRITSIAIYVLTLWILLSETLSGSKPKSINRYLNISAIILIIITIFISNFSSVAHTHHNCIQEYREMIIALGIMAYTVDLYFISFTKLAKD